MEIKLDDNTIRQAVSEAIVLAIDEKKRETLIAAAICKMLEAPPGSSGYGTRQPAPIQQIFEQQVYQFASEVVREKLAADGEFKARISKVISGALDKAFTDADGELTTHISKLMVDSLRPKERY